MARIGIPFPMPSSWPSRCSLPSSRHKRRGKEGGEEGTGRRTKANMARQARPGKAEEGKAAEEQPMRTMEAGSPLVDGRMQKGKRQDGGPGGGKWPAASQQSVN